MNTQKEMRTSKFPSNLKTMNFEDYLRQIHAKHYKSIDDDMPDAYEAWLASLDTVQLIELADEFGLEITKEVREVVKDELIR